MAPFVVRLVKLLIRTKRRKVRRIVIHRNGNTHRHRGHLAEDLDNNLTQLHIRTEKEHSGFYA